MCVETTTIEIEDDGWMDKSLAFSEKRKRHNSFLGRFFILIPSEENKTIKKFILIYFLLSFVESRKKKKYRRTLLKNAHKLG